MPKPNYLAFEGIVAGTNLLYSMSENVTSSLKNANYRKFGIVAEGDEVFMRLMHEMRNEMLAFELKIIKDSKSLKNYLCLSRNF